MLQGDEMKDISIENISIDSIKPYQNNPRNNDDAVDAVAASIKEFGFKVPIVIDANNVIVTGHTRFKAANRLGMKKVPCIRADDLTDEQVKAFRLADNKVSELATWNAEKLNIELEDIDIDMSEFGFDIPDIETVELDSGEDAGYYGDERERTNNAYNLGLIDYNSLTNNFWQMPIIKNDNFMPDDLIGFNYAKTSQNKNCGIHFYTFQVVQQKIDYELYDSAKRVAKSDYSVSSDFSTTPSGKRVKAADNFADRYNKYRKYTKISNEIYDRAIKRGLVQI